MHQDEKVDLRSIYGELLNYSRDAGWYNFPNLEYIDSDRIIEIFKKAIDEIKKYKKEIEESTLILEQNLEEISNTYDLLSALLEITNILSRDINPFKVALEIVDVIEKNIMAREISLFLFDEGNEFEFSTPNAKNTKEFFKSYILTSKSVIMNDSIPLMVIPIQSGEEFNGAFVCMGKENGTFFSAADRKLVEATSKQLKLALSNYSYFKNEMKRAMIEKELAIARDIQYNLFPHTFPPDYKIWGASLPAREIGGDYYDAFERNDKLFLTVADVSGKGIGAAIMMSMFRSYLKSLSSKSDLHEIATLLNHLMCEELSEDRFVTAVIGIFDPRSKTFEYVNAGHDPVFIFSNGKIKLLESENPPFGVIENDDFYIPKNVKLSENDLLVMYTDGFPEARNDKNEEYGLERLFKKIVELNSKSPAEIVKFLLEDVKIFSQSAVQHDDMTILVVRG
ncbi:MAG: PP2C family protein-serine/threonine phosphatase [Athalassotoga sp.]|uniref:PP2C family protein-serine/threonine phosphatase n=1 Tax=Athalassotoga sp. TaxID=2022597 RepID=UPI003CFF52C2